MGLVKTLRGNCFSFLFIRDQFNSDSVTVVTNAQSVSSPLKSEEIWCIRLEKIKVLVGYQFLTQGLSLLTLTLSS